MRIVSFAMTTVPLLFGEKSVTRRAWAPKWAAQFHKGDEAQAWDKSPRAKGQRVGTIRLTAEPVLESTAKLRIQPHEFYQEGFGCMESLGLKIEGLEPRAFWARWCEQPVELWTVRLELIEVTDYGDSLREPYEISWQEAGEENPLYQAVRDVRQFSTSDSGVS